MIPKAILPVEIKGIFLEIPGKILSFIESTTVNKDSLSIAENCSLFSMFTIGVMVTEQLIDRGRILVED